MRRDRLTTALRRARRLVLARRRPLAALLAAVAVGTGIHAAAAPPPATVGVEVAAHDLPAGTTLRPDDLRTVGFAPGSVPAAAAYDAAGRTLAAPLRAGEPVTDVRLVGPGLTDGYPGLSAVPVRLPDAGLVDLLHVGDRVDLIATDPQEGGASVVAHSVPLLAVPDVPAQTGATGLPGRLVVIGAQPAEVPQIAEAAARAFVTIAFPATTVAR